MTFAEILIIYLSLGAPVAVYHYQHVLKLHENASIVRSLLALILWPAALVRVFVDAPAGLQQRRAQTNADDDSDLLLQRVFDIAKREFDLAGRGGELASFREVAERYAGLTRAERNGDVALSTAAEFYRVAGHPQPQLAAVCSTRRAAEKLRSHVKAVSVEMRELFSADASPELAGSAAELAVSLGDRATAEFLSNLQDEQTRTGPFAIARKATRAA